MKTATIEKQVDGGNKTGNGARRARKETRRDALLAPKASGDRQTVEIERTFSVRWEW